VLLVHPKKETKGHWEVKWMWLPQFLAMDKELVKQVDQHLTNRFSGADLSHPYLPLEMHRAVIDQIVERYKFPGLRAYLEGVMAVSSPVENV
jgi:hypothetical protein